MTTAAEDSRLARRRRVLMLGVPALLLTAGALAYLLGGREISTDNAYVKAVTVDVMPEVAGTVVALPVKTNDRVKSGDLLFAIDARAYEIAVRAAQSELYIQWARVEALRPEMREVAEKRKKARTEAEYLAHEVERLEGLREKHAVSEAQLDDMRHRRDAVRAEIDALAQEYERAGVALGHNVNLPKEKHPFYTLALARLDQAKLDLSRTRVLAPMDGVVTAKRIAAGDIALPGQTALSLVQDTGMWVEANLKETELVHVVPGLPVRVRLDVYPGETFAGEVESISPATGAEFALLPPQNASGNWVKVVQRVPVRIRLKPRPGQPPLRAGLSAEIAIDTGLNRLQRIIR